MYNDDEDAGVSPASPSRPLLGGSSSSLDRHGGRLTVSDIDVNSDDDDKLVYTYAYGPSGVAGLAHNRLALACAAFASLGGLTFGYDQGVIANVLVMRDFVARWPIGAWERGLMTAVLELGCLFGALGAGILADRLSRRTSIMFACAIFSLGSTIQCAAQTLLHLTAGRAIGGLGVGALSMLSPLYMAEISPPEVRGSLLALEQLSIVLGCVVGFWAGFFTRNVPGSASWRIPLSVQLIPGILLGVGMLYLPASPRLLVLQGKIERARETLARIRRRRPDDPLVEIELLEMRVDARMQRLTQVPGKPEGAIRTEARAWAQLFSPRFRDRTTVGVAVMFFQQWSGINALLYYGPMLMRSLGFRGQDSELIVAGGVNVVQFLAVLPTIFFIDKWGRRPLLRAGSIVMAASHLAVAGIVHTYGPSWANHSGAAWSALLCVYLFTAAYGASIGPVAWVLPSEVFPLSVRGKGVAVSTASNWVNNFLIGLVTPPLMEASPSLTFGVFGASCCASYFWATRCVPETANMSLEAIDGAFASAAGREDAVYRRQMEREVGLDELVRRLGGSMDG